MPDGVVFVYKCPAGHVTEKVFDHAVPYADNDEIALCPECYKLELPPRTAYLVFAFPERLRKKTECIGK